MSALSAFRLLRRPERILFSGVLLSFVPEYLHFVNVHLSLPTITGSSFFPPPLLVSPTTHTRKMHALTPRFHPAAVCFPFLKTPRCSRPLRNSESRGALPLHDRHGFSVPTAFLSPLTKNLHLTFPLCSFFLLICPLACRDSHNPVHPSGFPVPQFGVELPFPPARWPYGRVRNIPGRPNPIRSQGTFSPPSLAKLFPSQLEDFPYLDDAFHSESNFGLVSLSLFTASY